MSFTIPNNGGAYDEDLSVWMDADIDAIVRGFIADGVLTNCAVTAQGSPDMTVAVAAGTVQINGVSVAVTGANGTITTADSSNPRLDVVSINSSGTIVVTAGTPAAEPAIPTIPASSAILALVRIPANDTTISSTQIVDKRVFVRTVPLVGAVGSEPSSPRTGDIYFPNNGFWFERYSGSAWVPWGPLFPFTDPALAGLSTWVNQGSATVTTTNGGIVLFGPGGGNTNNTVLRVKSAPATPYTITACIIPGMPCKSFLGCGISFRESSSGKLQNVGYTFNTALTPAFQIQAEKWTTATASSAAYVAVGAPLAVPIFLRITDNGTNRISYFSTDGVNFTQFHSVVRTDFLTADQVGIFVMSQNLATPNYGVYNTLLSWLET